MLQRELSAYQLCEPGTWPYEPVLCRVKMREFWELELNDLIRAVADVRKIQAEEDTGTKPGRLCYVTDGHRITEVREQNRLKNGTWGKGKKLSYVRYESCNATADDLLELLG